MIFKKHTEPKPHKENNRGDMEKHTCTLIVWAEVWEYQVPKSSLVRLCYKKNANIEIKQNKVKNSMKTS